MSIDSNATVLVVEDERTLADLYAAWLRESYTVRTAYDGTEALAALDESIDVVLLDRRMPDVSGDEVLSEIRERGLDCRVAMVTAVEPDFDIIEMGFDDYVVKPVTERDLESLLEGLVTRATYTEKLDEYATLAAKKSALEAEKTPTELEASEEFAALEARIEALEAELDPIAQGFDEEDLFAVFRELPSPSGA